MQEALRDKIYKVLGLESLQSRRSLHRLCTFHKIKTSGLPSYLFKLIPDTSYHYFTRSIEKISEWNKLCSKIQNLSSSAFKEHLIKGIRPPANSVFNIHNLIGLKYITRSRLGLSH